VAGFNKCKECGAVVSKRAAACPQCGAPAKRKTSRLTWLVVVVVAVGFVSIMSSESSRETAQKEAIATAAWIAKQQQEDADYFNLHRADILPEIRSLIDAKDLAGAVALANKYAPSNDGELIVLQAEAKTLQIRGELRAIPAAEYEKNRVLYAQLVSLNPGNAQYEAKLAHYADKQAAADLLIKTRAERTELISRGFSAWDGSHIRLERAVKKSMNDPDSYEHAETRYFDRGDHLVVHTTFRGKNAFGGVVMQTVKAKVDLDGEVIQVLSE